MKTIFQKIRRLLGKDPDSAKKVNIPKASPAVANRRQRATDGAPPASPSPPTSSAPSHRIYSPGDIPYPRRRGRIRSYAEEEANHDLWVAGLSPLAVACAARDLTPKPRSRWRLRQKERPPTAYEIWRIERHAALLRRMDSDRGQ